MCLALAIIGIVPTFSRSGMIVYVLTFLVFCVLHFRTHSRQILLTVGLGLGLGSMAIGAFAMTVKDDNAKNRLAGIFGGESSKMASSERMKDLSDGLEAALQRPLTGHGMGSGTLHWKPHNQFVSLWVDMGIFVAAAYILLLLTLLIQCILHHRMATLLMVPHLAFIPFTQMQLEAVNVLYSLLLAAYLGSHSRIRFSLTSPPTS